MVLPNPRTTYKAQLLDYDALLAAADTSCSYCLTEREVQMLLAFVDYIAWKTRYINTTTEIDTNLIRTWSNNLARKLMDGCCDDNDLHRFSPDGVYQSSSDGGVTWVDDPEDDPRNTYIGTPPLPGAPGASKKCAAADNVQSLFTQYRDNLIEIVGATPTIIAIIAGILAFIAVLAGVSGVGVGISVIFLTMAAEIISIGGTGISGAITFTALETFRCLVYCRMDSDGQLTYASWQQLLVDIAGEFDGFAETFFYQTINGMGYIGVNNAGTMGAATADDCDDCGCAIECCTEAQITLGTLVSITEEGGCCVMRVESQTIPDSGGFEAVSIGNYGEGAGTYPCCHIFAWTQTGSTITTTGWTSCEGSLHDPGNPETHDVAHAYWSNGIGHATEKFTVAIVFGTGCE